MNLTLNLFLQEGIYRLHFARIKLIYLGLRSGKMRFNDGKAIENDDEKRKFTWGKATGINNPVYVFHDNSMTEWFCKHKAFRLNNHHHAPVTAPQHQPQKKSKPLTSSLAASVSRRVTNVPILVHVSPLCTGALAPTFPILCLVCIRIFARDAPVSTPY